MPDPAPDPMISTCAITRQVALQLAGQADSYVGSHAWEQAGANVNGNEPGLGEPEGFSWEEDYASEDPAAARRAKLLTLSNYAARPRGFPFATQRESIAFPPLAERPYGWKWSPFNPENVLFDDPEGSTRYTTPEGVVLHVTGSDPDHFSIVPLAYLAAVAEVEPLRLVFLDPSGGLPRHMATTTADLATTLGLETTKSGVGMLASPFRSKHVQTDREVGRMLDSMGLAFALGWLDAAALAVVQSWYRVAVAPHYRGIETQLPAGSPFGTGGLHFFFKRWEDQVDRWTMQPWQSYGYVIPALKFAEAVIPEELREEARAFRRRLGRQLVQVYPVGGPMPSFVAVPKEQATATTPVEVLTIEKVEHDTTVGDSFGLFSYAALRIAAADGIEGAEERAASIFQRYQHDSRAPRWLVDAERKPVLTPGTQPSQPHAVAAPEPEGVAEPVL